MRYLEICKKGRTLGSYSVNKGLAALRVLTGNGSSGCSSCFSLSRFLIKNILFTGNAFSTTYNPPSMFPGSSSGAHIQAPPAPRSTYAPQQSTIAQMPYNVAVHNNRRNNSTVSGRGRIIQSLSIIYFFIGLI